MNRRKDGRELFEVFRETMHKASTAPPEAGQQPAPAKPEPRLVERPARFEAEPDEPEHVIKLGDSRQVLIVLSNSWIYGLSFFLVLILAGAFVMGRRFAPVREAPVQVDAPEALANEARRVGDVSFVNTPTVVDQARPVAEQPTYVPVEAQPQPRPQPAPAPEAGNWTICVSTRSSPNSEQTLEAMNELVTWLKAQGFADARTLVDKPGRFRVVAVGRFDMSTSPDAKQAISKLSQLTFKGKSLRDAYFVTLKNYQ